MQSEYTMQHYFLKQSSKCANIPWHVERPELLQPATDLYAINNTQLNYLKCEYKVFVFEH